MKKKLLFSLNLAAVLISGCSNEKQTEVGAESVQEHGNQDKLEKLSALEAGNNAPERQAEKENEQNNQKEATPKEIQKKKSEAQPKHQVKSDSNVNSNLNKNKTTEPKSTKHAQQYSNTKLPTIDMRLPQQNSAERNHKITHIVLHFISNAAVKPKDPYQVQDIRNLFINYGVSAHYLIGREGEIYFLVPENRVAYHAGKGSLANFPQYKDKLNDHSIGIEIMAIGTEEEMSSMVPAHTYHSIEKSRIGFTNAQYESLNRLIEDIVKRNQHIKKDRKHIIGHDEYASSRKTDPGSLFNWSNIDIKRYD